MREKSKYLTEWVLSIDYFSPYFSCPKELNSLKQRSYFADDIIADRHNIGVCGTDLALESTGKKTGEFDEKEWQQYI